MCSRVGLRNDDVTRRPRATCHRVCTGVRACGQTGTCVQAELRVEVSERVSTSSTAPTAATRVHSFGCTPNVHGSARVLQCPKPGNALQPATYQHRHQRRQPPGWSRPRTMSSPFARPHVQRDAKNPTDAHVNTQHQSRLLSKDARIRGCTRKRRGVWQRGSRGLGHTWPNAWRMHKCRCRASPVLLPGFGQPATGARTHRVRARVCVRLAPGRAVFTANDANMCIACAAGPGQCAPRTAPP